MHIEKSAVARQKEKQIAEVEQQIRRTRTTLKSLKTRLANTQSRIEEVQRDAFNQISRFQEQFLGITKKLEALTNKLRKDKRLSKADKDLIDEVYRGLVGGLEENLPNLGANAYDPGKEDKAQFRDAFKEFRVEPPQEEQRDIRKLYLNLSKQFHPDLARSEKEKKQFHELQQQINEAYEGYDIQRLIDLEQLWERPQEETLSTLDALDLKIASLKTQLQLLQQQQARLSREIEQLRNSDLGHMLTQVDGMERAGYTLEDSAELKQVTEMIDLLEKLQVALIDTDYLGRISPLLTDLLQEMMDTAGAVEHLMYGMMGMEDDENDEGFMYWDEDMPNPDPVFLPGSIVRVAKDTEIDYYDDQDREYVFNVKGYTGTVTAAMIDDEDEPYYHVQLDIASMNRLPGLFIETEGPSFYELEFYEEVLVKEKPKRKESLEVVRRAGRELYYRYSLAQFPKDRQERLQRILLAQPAGDDESNWLACFAQRLPLPLTVHSRGLFHHYLPDRKVKITNYGGFSPESGIMVITKVGKQQDLAPLAEFKGTDKGPIAELLDDYLEWFDLVF